MFAAVLITLGSVGLVRGELTPVWEPIPKTVPARELLAYLCAAVFVGCGVGVLVRRIAAVAARVLLAALLLWLVIFRVRAIIRAPATFPPWDGCAETAVVVAGAWVLYAWLATDWDKRRVAFATGDSGVRIARILYGLALIAFGVAHFLYIDDTASLVPRWLPAHVGLTYFTGGAFVAAAAGVLIGVSARLAAALAALQIGLFTVLVWIPIVAAGSANAFQWSELGISAALTAAAWLVADSYRDARWLAVRSVCG